MRKNQTHLSSFTVYCRNHPEQRFWQALRNWSGYRFIYGQKEGDFLVGGAKDAEGKEIILHDTFYD